MKATDVPNFIESISGYRDISCAAETSSELKLFEVAQGFCEQFVSTGTGAARATACLFCHICVALNIDYNVLLSCFPSSP